MDPGLELERNTGFEPATFALKALPTRLGEARRELFRLLDTRVNPFERTSCRDVPIAT